MWVHRGPRIWHRKSYLLAQKVAGLRAREPKPWQKISPMGAIEQCKGKAQHVSVPCTLKVMICKETMCLSMKMLLSGCQRCVHFTSVTSKSRFLSHAVTFMFATIFETNFSWFVRICTAVCSVHGLTT